jgi:hypothetical protein
MPRITAVFSAKSFHATLLLPPKPQNGKPTFDFFKTNFYDFFLLFRFFFSQIFTPSRKHGIAALEQTTEITTRRKKDEK